MYISINTIKKNNVMTTDEIKEAPILTIDEKKTIIKNSIKFALKISPNIQATNTLVNVLYAALCDFFIENKKYVVVEAPTGSGKSVIGYLLHFCFDKCMEEIFNSGFGSSYFLTSSKMLQEQIEQDFDRFHIRGVFSMLKGQSNYRCMYFESELEARDNNLNKLGLITAIDTSKEKEKVSKDVLTYDKRYCMGFDGKERSMLGCFPECEYINQRQLTSGAPCAVLNYAYFLNVMKSDANPFFSKRQLTICDEAHLLPDIVCNMFSYEITRYQAVQLMRIVEAIKKEYYEKVSPITGTISPLAEVPANEGICRDMFDEAAKNIPTLMGIFDRQMRTVQEALAYYELLNRTITNLTSICDLSTKTFKMLFQSKIGALGENEDGVNNNQLIVQALNDLSTRRDDAFVKSEVKFNSNFFTHTVRDLSETELIKRNFIDKIEYGFFMSATLGNTNEYSKMLGLPPEDTSSYRLRSTFDFKKSPIYLCKSGWLNWKNFKENIDTVLDTCLHICETIHPDEKGIIHTSTFKIADLLMEKLNQSDYGGNLIPIKDKTRYRFYRTPQQKEQCVAELKSSETPLIIIGPSLYEGLDLKGDEGRFNILVKVPYPGIDDYVKAKMERIPFWYSRVTLEKVVQAIGRTNRYVEDYSTTYLLDSLFDKIVDGFNEDMSGRLKLKKIYLPEKNKPKVVQPKSGYASVSSKPNDKPKSEIDKEVDSFFDDLPF